MDIVFDPIIDVAYILIIAVALIAATLYVYLDVSRRLPRPRRWLLLSLRLAALLLLLLLLLQPSRRRELPRDKREKVTVVAIDRSMSMRQADVDGRPRIDAAKDLLLDSKLLSGAAGGNDRVRLFGFGDGAAPLTAPELTDLAALDGTTLFHKSLLAILDGLEGTAAAGIVFLSDGHDFGEHSAMQTALYAKSHHVPLFAVPVGGQGVVRDVSAQIVAHQSHAYTKQTFRIDAFIRQRGCDHEDLVVQLKRNGQVVETRKANIGARRELSIEFAGMEEETGQVEYEVAVSPLVKEVDPDNNSSAAYISVIDQRVRVLLLEGEPYWDTTFLRRSLFRNDKVELDAIVQYTPKRARRLRNVPGDRELEVPRTAEEFRRYDVVLLGRSVDQLLPDERLRALHAYVKEKGGSVVFTRANAYRSDLAEARNLMPVIWDADGHDHVRLTIGQGSGSVSPLVGVVGVGGAEGRSSSLPPLILSRNALEKRTLAMPMALAGDADAGLSNPGIMYRPYGRGQVLSFGVDGLWRWGFHPQVNAEESELDRFWNQVLIWLVMNGDLLPGEDVTFKVSTSNLALGEKLYIKYSVRNPDGVAAPRTATIVGPDGEESVVALSPISPETPGRLQADFVPPAPGKYRAIAERPDHTAIEAKFIVYHDRPEEKEVALDLDYLAALCTASGGRVIAPEELADLPDALRRDDRALRKKVRIRRIWDKAWVLYVIVALMGVDWFCRRKWGMC